MRRRTAKPSQLVIRQAINFIFDHKKRQDEKEKQFSPIVRIISRGGSNSSNDCSN